jgi:hypothetical protein
MNRQEMIVFNMDNYPNMKVVGAVKVSMFVPLYLGAMFIDPEGLGLVDKDVDDFRTYINAFYVMVIENLNRNTLTEVYWERTISVSSVGVEPRIKKLSVE